MRMASALLVAAAAAASAWNTHRNGFVWDDRSAVVANKDVRADRALWEVFTHDFWGAPISSIDSHKSYRPLTVLSFRLNFWTSGGDISSALHFHVGNMLIHVGCSLLVWKVAQALFLKQYQPQQQDQKFSGPQTLYFKRMGATLAALLFAVHPIHCDAVASVVGRADLLCTMLSLLAFLSYVDAVEHQGRTKWSAFILAIVYAVAGTLHRCICICIAHTPVDTLAYYLINYDAPVLQRVYAKSWASRCSVSFWRTISSRSSHLITMGIRT